jgi:hypothetical protein
MSKVLWHITISLDGFIAPHDYSTEWMFEHGSAGPMGREVMERTGAILAGRRGYDLGMRAGSGPRAIYGDAWQEPVFVLTHRPGDSVSGVTFPSGSIQEAVATAWRRQAPRTSGCSESALRAGASAPGSWTRSSSTWCPCCWATASGCSA